MLAARRARVSLTPRAGWAVRTSGVHCSDGRAHSHIPEACFREATSVFGAVARGLGKRRIYCRRRVLAVGSGYTAQFAVLCCCFFRFDGFRRPTSTCLCI